MDELPYPPSIQRLIDEFGRLPGIGRRSAERLAFHILALPRAEAMRLALAIRDAKNNLRACSVCFNVAEGGVCGVCADPRREDGVLCVVELPRDLIALEKSGAYRGRYHVLQGRLAPADGVGPDDLRVKELAERLAAAARSGSPVREVIVATNPTAEGDATAHFLRGFLTDPPPEEGARAAVSGTPEAADGKAKTDDDATAARTGGGAGSDGLAWPPPRVTRLARGLSAGAELESIASSAVRFALEGRQPLNADSY